MLTEIEKMVIAAIQGDIPVTERPYLQIAQSVGISEEALLQTLAALCANGTVRRFGATLRHQKTGFEANAMAAWQVDEDRVAEVGKQMAGFSQVSHCYRRDPTGTWPYNLYTMVHAQDEAGCRGIVRRMAEATGVKTHILLFSRKELKKTSMEYFPTDDLD